MVVEENTNDEEDGSEEKFKVITHMLSLPDDTMLPISTK
jgi:hypothetical protein